MYNLVKCLKIRFELSFSLFSLVDATIYNALSNSHLQFRITLVMPWSFMTLEVEHLIIFGLVYLAAAWLFGLEFKTTTFPFCDVCFFELEPINGFCALPKATLDLLSLENILSCDDILFFVHYQINI